MGPGFEFATQVAEKWNVSAEGEEMAQDAPKFRVHQQRGWNEISLLERQIRSMIAVS
jgi:hypothetical protein